MTKVKDLSSKALVGKLKNLVAEEKKNIAAQIALLREIKQRNLALELGYPSLMAFCEEELGLTKDQAWKRSQAAGAVQREPELFTMLATGQTSLSAVAVVASKITEQTKAEIKQFLPHKTKREAEAFVSTLNRDGTRQAKLQTVRRSFDLTLATEDKLKHAARLLRQNRQDITPAEVLDAALELLIEKRDPVRKAARAKARLEKKNQKKRVENTVDAVTPAPGQANPASQSEKKKPVENIVEAVEPAPGQANPASQPEKKKPVENIVEAVEPAPEQANPAFQLEKNSRYIPAAVRHTVYGQERGRCAYISPTGRRCPAAIGLHLDHRKPFSHGGQHTVQNLRLLCPAHNRFVAPSGATG